MTEFSALDIIPNAIAAATFLMSLAFVIVYAKYSNWTKTAPGRALMYWAISFDALILMNTVHLWTGRYPGIEFVRMVAYSLLLLSVARLLYALISILRNGRPITLATFIDLDKEKNMTDRTVTQVTPIWFPWQRVKRVLVTLLFTVVPTLNIAVPQIVEAFDGHVSPELFAIINTVAAGILVVAGVITRLLAVPAINQLLVWLGLGSVPRSAIEQ